jgi:hypothetical protein
LSRRQFEDDVYRTARDFASRESDIRSLIEGAAVFYREPM